MAAYIGGVMVADLHPGRGRGRGARLHGRARPSRGPTPRTPGFRPWLPEQPTQRKVWVDRRRRRGRRPIGRGRNVYARSTTVLAHLESIDAGVAHIRNEVMPTL